MRVACCTLCVKYCLVVVCRFTCWSCVARVMFVVRVCVFFVRCASCVV